MNLLIGKFTKDNIEETLEELYLEGLEELEELEIDLEDLRDDVSYFLNFHTLNAYNDLIVYPPKRLFSFFKVIPAYIKLGYPALFVDIIKSIKIFHSDTLYTYLNTVILLENYKFIMKTLNELNELTEVNPEIEEIPKEAKKSSKIKYKSLVERVETESGKIYFKLSYSSGDLYEKIISHTKESNLVKVDIADIDDLDDLKDYEVLQLKFISKDTDLTTPANIQRKYTETIRKLKKEPGFSNWKYKNITQKMYDGLKGRDDKWNRCANEFFYWDGDKVKCTKRCELHAEEICDKHSKCEFGDGYCNWKNPEDESLMDLNSKWSEIDNFINVSGISGNEDEILASIIADKDLIINSIFKKSISGVLFSDQSEIITKQLKRENSTIEIQLPFRKRRPLSISYSDIIWDIMHKTLIKECMASGYKRETVIFNLKIVFDFIDKLQLEGENPAENRELYKKVKIVIKFTDETHKKLLYNSVTNPYKKKSDKADKSENIFSSIEPSDFGIVSTESPRDYWADYFSFFDGNSDEISEILKEYPKRTMQNAIWMIMKSLDIESGLTDYIDEDIVEQGPNAIIDYWGLGIEQEVNVLLGPISMAEEFVAKVDHYTELFTEIKEKSLLPSGLNPDSGLFGDFLKNPKFIDLLRVSPEDLDLTLDKLDLKEAILKQFNINNIKEFYICASDLKSSSAINFRSTQLVYYILKCQFNELAPSDILPICYVFSLIEDFIDSVFSIDLSEYTTIPENHFRRIPIKPSSELPIIDIYIQYMICYIAACYILNQFKQNQLKRYSETTNISGSLYTIITGDLMTGTYTYYKYSDDKFIVIKKYMNALSKYRDPYDHIEDGESWSDSHDIRFIDKYKEAKTNIFSFQKIIDLGGNIEFDHGSKYEIKTDNFLPGDDEYLLNLIGYGLNNELRSTITELDFKKENTVKKIQEFYKVPVFLTDKYTYYKLNILYIRNNYYYVNSDSIDISYLWDPDEAREHNPIYIDISADDKYDYSGEVEINLTLPLDINNIDIDEFKSNHIILMKSLQLLSPLFLACWTGVNPGSYGDNHTVPETSFRFVDYAGIRLLATDVDIIYDAPHGDYYVNEDDDDAPPTNPDFIQTNKLLSKIYKPFKDLSDITKYFPQEFSVNRKENSYKYNPEKGAYFGFEWKMLDQYPTEYIYPIVLFILLLSEWSLTHSDLAGSGSIIEKYAENWDKLREFVTEIVYEGWNTKVTPEFIDFINESLNLGDLVELNPDDDTTCYGYLNAIYEGLFSYWRSKKEECRFINKFCPEFMDDDFRLPVLPNINKLNNNYMISEYSEEDFDRLTSKILGFDTSQMTDDEIQSEISELIQTSADVDEDVVDLYYYLRDKA